MDWSGITNTLFGVLGTIAVAILTYRSARAANRTQETTAVVSAAVEDRKVDVEGERVDIEGIKARGEEWVRILEQHRAAAEDQARAYERLRLSNLEMVEEVRALKERVDKVEALNRSLIIERNALERHLRHAVDYVVSLREWAKPFVTPDNPLPPAPLSLDLSP